MTMYKGARYANMPDVRLVKQPPVLITSVSLNIDVVTTAILAEQDLSMYDRVLLVFINDGASEYTVTVSTGEVTGAVDTVLQPAIIVPAASGGAPGQNTHLIGPDNMRTFWRATGIATGALTAARFIMRGFFR